MKETSKVLDPEIDCNSDNATLDWPAALLKDKKKVLKRSRGMKRCLESLNVSDERVPKVTRTSTHALTPISKREFKSVCHPNSICNAIQSGFSDKQREAIEEIGFGGLLRMRIRVTPLDLYGWLLDAFNPKNGIVSVNGRAVFQVSKHDIRDIFLLPNEGFPVRETERTEGTRLRRLYLEKYKALSKGKDRLTLERVMVVMKNLREGCDDFKRFFVMYVVSCFLAPTSNRTIRIGILGSLNDVSKIPKMDWCKYVLDHLCSSIQLWRDDETQQHVGGCLMVLQACYMQRHSWWGEVLPKELPLIQNLDGDDVKERIEQELDSGGFGLGIFDLEGYPISKKGSGNAGSHREITWEVDSDLLMDSVIERLYPNEFDASLAKARRDLELFSRRNMPRLMLSDSGASESCTRDALSLSQDIDKMVDGLQKLKELVKERRNSVVVYRTPSDSTDHVQTDSVEVEQCYIPKFMDPSDSPARAAEKCYTPNLEELLMDSPVEANNWPVPYADPIAEGLQHAEKHLLDSNTPSPQASGLIHTQLCRIVESFGSQLMVPGNTCGSSQSTRNSRVDKILDELKAMEDVHFKSKLLHDYPTNMKQLQKHDAMISDFCIAKHEELPRSYVVFSDGGMCLADASDFSSLDAGTEVATSILNAFARTINSRTAKTSKPLMVCLDVIPNYGPLIADCVVFTLWNNSLEKSMLDFLSAEMVLLPVLIKDHYFAVVANIKSSKFQYLDNLTHIYTIDEWMEHVVSLRKLVSDYMFMRGHHKAGEVTRYEIETVGGSWRSDTGNNDCGVYVMHHMRHFRGEGSLDNDALTARKRDVFRAQVCAKLVCNRFNTRSLNVLEDVLEYHKGEKS